MVNGEVEEKFTDIFFMHPSDVLKLGIENQYKSKIEPMNGSKDAVLWKLIS